MSSEIGKTYYEVLNVAQDVSQEEINEAFRVARSTYQQGSLATYSLFEEAEQEAAIEELEDAYQILSDPVRRRKYDAQLGQKDDPESEIQPEENGSRSPFPPRTMMDPEYGPSRGSYLTRVREAQGLTISDVAEATSLNRQYLEAIEKEEYDRLPSGSYRIFMLRAYAAHLGLKVEDVLKDFKSRVNT